MRVMRGRGKRERSPEGVSGMGGKLQGMMRRRRWPKICARKNKNAEGGRRASWRKSHPRPAPRSMTSFPAMLSPPSRTSAQTSSPSSRCGSLICNSSSDCPHWRSELRCGVSCISLRFNTLECSACITDTMSTCNKLNLLSLNYGNNRKYQ